MKAVHEAAVPHAGPHNVRAWWQAWLHYRAEGSWHGRKRRRHRRGQGCTSALSLLASRQAAARMDAGVAEIPHTWLHATSGTVGGKVPLSRAGVQATARTWLGAKVHTARKRQATTHTAAGKAAQPHERWEARVHMADGNGAGSARRAAARAALPLTWLRPRLHKPRTWFGAWQHTPRG